MGNTYTETVFRWVVERHEVLPEEHQKAYIADGLDPNSFWSLVWSFKTKEDAVQKRKQLQENAAWFQSYRIRDLGSDTTIERPIW